MMLEVRGFEQLGAEGVLLGVRKTRGKRERGEKVERRRQT
jgi:hypothetical protein